MRPALIVAIAVVVAAVAASAAYFALSAQGGPAAALRNAEALSSRNITATYEISAGLAEASPLFPRYVRGVVTISRTPIGDAAVVNGTVAVQAGLAIFRARLDLALWRSGGELCYGLRLAGLHVARCVPYSDLAQEYEAVLNESKYIGVGNWNGEATYCFSATALASIRGAPVVVNASKICLLQNGVPANATLYIYPEPRGPVVEINLTLVGYSFYFNQGAFAEVTGGLLPAGG